MGGRRRSAASKPTPKRRPKLDKIFKCPLCSHHEAAIVTIQRRPTEPGGPLTAGVKCKVCHEKFTYPKTVTYLTEHVDIMGAWIDALEDERLGNTSSNKRRSQHDAYDEEDERASKRVRPTESVSSRLTQQAAAESREKALLESLLKEEVDDALPHAAASGNGMSSKTVISDDEDEDE